jgi:hypothetical protein
LTAYHAPDHAGASRADSPDAQRKRNSSSVAVILGEFRANLSDLLFMKTERYLDSGIAYLPHIDSDSIATSGKIDGTETTGTGAAPLTAADTTQALMDRLATSKMQESASGQACAEHGEHHDHDHEGIVETIIRTPERDFRGFIGNLERNVKPWRDPRLPHQHTGGTELLPWYRLATLANPNNVRAYMIGAWWLKTVHTREQRLEALKFLDEGIRNNPRAFQLHLMRGYVLRQLEKEVEALFAFRKAASLVILDRPPDGEPGPDWTVYMEDDAVAACTMSVLMERDLNGTEPARHLLEDYRKKLLNMPVLERLLLTINSG